MKHMRATTAPRRGRNCIGVDARGSNFVKFDGKVENQRFGLAGQAEAHLWKLQAGTLKPDPEMQWTCKPCKFSVPHRDIDRVRKHLATKRHQRLRFACPVCSSLRMRSLDGETWDNDGIRPAKKCARCLTEFKCYAHGLQEKSASEYTGELPARIKQKLDAAFDAEARRRGYVKVARTRSSSHEEGAR